ncbi:MAG TPA: DUF2846 domain-containing protein [Stellaceae bacterium]|nr:DUF2846 domain-containing protein [Stellaceae bacterium]
MATVPPSRWRRRVELAGALMLIASGCAAPPPAAGLPVSPGQARIWFYRIWEPSESLNLANIDVNGGYFGSVANGSAFYRDVPPGRYHIAPASFVPNSNQDANVELVPGQQVYVKIVSSVSWGSDNTAAKNIERDAFYAWVIPPKAAQAEIAGGRSGI